MKSAKLPMLSPEMSALQFYYLNHAVAELSSRNTGLVELSSEGKKLANLYQDSIAQIGTRMFFYLLLICTRESRHERTNRNDKYWIALQGKYGEAFVKFSDSIEGTGSETAVNKFQSSTPDTTLGNYTKGLCEVFYTGDFHKSYGGKPWGDIAACLHSYVSGGTSLEAMVDTAFTLAHNNGPIFNKGLYFLQYNGLIYKILDVQRSGQIPQLVTCENVGKTTDDIKLAEATAISALGESFGKGYVDWFKVEALGSKHQYPSEKKAQVQLHGEPVKMKMKSPVLVGLSVSDDVQVLNDIGLGSVKITPTIGVQLVENNRE